MPATKVSQGSFPKNTKEGGDAYAEDQGMDYVAGAGKAGVSVYGFNVTSGGTPDTVLFATYGVPDMDNVTYTVLVDGETAADKVSVDESTKAITGFSILNGGNGEILNVVVIGTIAGQSA